MVLFLLLFDLAEGERRGGLWRGVGKEERRVRGGRGGVVFACGCVPG